MASRTDRQGATTHVSRHNGHGPKAPRQRFAVKQNRCVRGQPIKGKTAPWFLKYPLSRPESKRRRLAEAA